MLAGTIYNKKIEYLIYFKLIVNLILRELFKKIQETGYD
jgi:hypothetical protein